MSGPQQCDEDDYGYVSQEASAFYAKLMDKYSSMPAEEPKFPQGKKPVIKDLNAAKVSVLVLYLLRNNRLIIIAALNTSANLVFKKFRIVSSR